MDPCEVSSSSCELEIDGGGFLFIVEPCLALNPCDDPYPPVPKGGFIAIPHPGFGKSLVCITL